MRLSELGLLSGEYRGHGPAASAALDGEAWTVKHTSEWETRD